MLFNCFSSQAGKMGWKEIMQRADESDLEMANRANASILVGALRGIANSPIKTHSIYASPSSTPPISSEIIAGIIEEAELSINELEKHGYTELGKKNRLNANFILETKDEQFSTPKKMKTL